MSAIMCSVLGWLSFRRIVDIPFETCVAALESWQCTGLDGEPPIGESRLRGPIEHHLGSGTCRIEVRLARGPLTVEIQGQQVSARVLSEPPYDPSGTRLRG